MIVRVQELRHPFRAILVARSVQTLRKPIGVEKQSVTLAHVNSIHRKTLSAKYANRKTRRRNAGDFPILNQQRR